MTENAVKNYFKYDIEMEPRHCTKALAQAITDIAEELGYDEAKLLWLLIENRPIVDLHTHSYGFHTANGRHIIESIKEKYYEYKSTN